MDSFEEKRTSKEFRWSWSNGEVYCCVFALSFFESGGLIYRNSYGRCNFERLKLVEAPFSDFGCANFDRVVLTNLWINSQNHWATNSGYHW